MLSYLALFFSFIALASSVPVERSKREAETRPYPEEAFSPSHDDFLNYFVGNATEIAKDELFPPRKEKNEVAEEKEKKILETFGKSVRGVHHKMTDMDLVALSGILREALYKKRQEFQQMIPTPQTPTEEGKIPKDEDGESKPETATSKPGEDLKKEPQQTGEGGETKKDTNAEAKTDQEGDNNGVTPQPEALPATPPKEDDSSANPDKKDNTEPSPAAAAENEATNGAQTAINTEANGSTDSSQQPANAQPQEEVDAKAQKEPVTSSETTQTVVANSTNATTETETTKRRKREVEAAPEITKEKQEDENGKSSAGSSKFQEEEEDDVSKIYKVILHDFYPKEPLKDKGQFFAVIQRVFNVIRSHEDHERAAKILAMYYVQLKREQFS